MSWSLYDLLPTLSSIFAADLTLYKKSAKLHPLLWFSLANIIEVYSPIHFFSISTKWEFSSKWGGDFNALFLNGSHLFCLRLVYISRESFWARRSALRRAQGDQIGQMRKSVNCVRNASSLIKPLTKVTLLSKSNFRGKTSVHIWPEVIDSF